MIAMNEWTVSGEVFYLKEMEGEFAASVKLRGSSSRENSLSSQILEFSCLMEKEAYKRAVKNGLKMYRNVTLSGHFETWTRANDAKGKVKLMFIADTMFEVA